MAVLTLAYYQPIFINSRLRLPANIIAIE